MRINKLLSRAKKYARAKHTRRTRMAIVAFGAVLVVTGAVAVSSMFAAAPKPTDDQTAAMRAVENKHARAELAAPAADYAAASSTSGTATRANAAAVTLTGCLERHGDDYRLKDAGGPEAPRTRSWKSGFLKKSTPAIDVVDASNRLRLKDHIGERVSVTGVLNDREMQARTLKNVATSCS